MTDPQNDSECVDCGRWARYPQKRCAMCEDAAQREHADYLYDQRREREMEAPNA